MTKMQIKTFWPVFSSACRNLGLATREQKDAYREKLMWDADRAQHLADVGNGAGYERLMAAVSMDAGDYETAARVAGGSARRMAAMIDDCARQVFELSGREGDRMAYALAILEQSGVSVPPSSDWWLDLPEQAALRVFYSLDAHRRRLAVRLNGEQGSDIRLSYKFGYSVHAY